MEELHTDQQTHLSKQGVSNEDGVLVLSFLQKKVIKRLCGVQQQTKTGSKWLKNNCITRIE